MRRARAAGITSITAAKADARQLPFPAATFDAAYLVTVLGEIPDPAAAMSRAAPRPQANRATRCR